MAVAHSRSGVRCAATPSAPYFSTKADPSKVLARCAEPLVRPEIPDREGYVPNVVYTCGRNALFKDRIILPYAVSDTFSTVATMKISALLGSMQKC